MRRTTALVASLACLAILAPPMSVTAQESSIVGSWITTGWEGQDSDLQPGLLIFTETNYSIMFVIPGMIRERTGDTMTDADMVTAYNTLVANSGRYTQSGDQITTEAYVTLNPNYMADWGENHITYTFRVEGDTLHFTWPADFMEPGAPSFSGTFRKVG